MHKLEFVEGINDKMDRVVEAVTLLEEDNLKLYRTFVTTTETHFTLLTASKDLHLELGRLPRSAHIAFCDVVLNEFEAAGVQALVAKVKKDGRWVLITRQSTDGYETFHLSMA